MGARVRNLGSAMRQWSHPHLTFARAVTREGIPHAILASAADVLLAAVGGLLVVRFLDPSGYADLRVALTYISWLSIVCGLGMATPILRFCAGRVDERDSAQRLGEDDPVFNAAIKAGMWATIMLAGVAAVLAHAGLLMSSPASRKLFLWLLVSLPFGVASGYCVAYLQAVRELKRLAGRRIMFRVATVLVTLLAAVYAGVRGYAASLVVISAAWAMLMASTVGWRRFRHVGRPWAVPPGFLMMAAQSLLASIVWSVGRTGDLVMLDRLSADRSGIAAYAVAQTIVVMAGSLLGGLQTVAVPYFAEMRPGSGELRGRLWRNQVRLTSLAAISATCAWVAAAVFSVMFLGPSYRQLPVFAVLLLLGFVMQSTFSLVAAALIGIGRVDVNLKVAIVATAAGLGMCWAGFRQWGLLGMAIGQAGGLALYAVIQWTTAWPILTQRDQLDSI